MPRKPAKCGTNGGYVAHRRRGEDACEPCLKAHAKNRRDYVKTSPEQKQAELRRARAQRRATQRVVNAHMPEYQQYYKEEIRKGE